jgi:DNA-directed RNA polymerase subunit RPC12/RpoP
MAAAFLKFLLPPPLRRPLKNLNLLPYQVPTFSSPPLYVPNNQLFARSFSYLQYLPRPRRPRMPALKSVISRRQRAKYCTCPDCQSKRLIVNRVPYLPNYFRRRPTYTKPGGPGQVCKRKLHTDARSEDGGTSNRFWWGRLRRALRATKIEWYPIPVGLGIAYIAFAHLRKMRERGWGTPPEGDGQPPQIKKPGDVKVHGPWQVYVLSTLPLRSISRLWGKFNAIELPVFMRVPGYKLYAWIFGCQLDELKEPDLTKYRNLAEFFSRELRDGARIIDPTAALVQTPRLTVLMEGISCGWQSIAFRGD